MHMGDGMGKIRALIGVLLLLLATQLPVQGTAVLEARSAELVTAEAAVRAELDAQVVAWNRGDLKGYMEGYWHSQEVTFFYGSRESAGWEVAYQRYRAAYLGKNKEMGHLNFSNIRVEAFCPEAAFVRGYWQLTMKDGSERTGVFTVVMKHFSEGWRIIHDHSS
jgi:beta-aspartyl-peptidase (threonine type)